MTFYLAKLWVDLPLTLLKFLQNTHVNCHLFSCCKLMIIPWFLLNELIYWWLLILINCWLVCVRMVRLEIPSEYLGGSWSDGPSHDLPLLDHIISDMLCIPSLKFSCRDLRHVLVLILVGIIIKLLLTTTEAPLGLMMTRPGRCFSVKAILSNSALPF
jgi:hypothetical protein